MLASFFQYAFNPPFFNLLKPVLDVIQLWHGNGVDVDRCAMEVLKDKDHIKVLQSKLDTFQVSNFNFAQGDDQERWIRQVNETIGCGLQQYIRSERHTSETKFPEWHIYFDTAITLSYPN